MNLDNETKLFRVGAEPVEPQPVVATHQQVVPYVPEGVQYVPTPIVPRVQATATLTSSSSYPRCPSEWQQEPDVSISVDDLPSPMADPVNVPTVASRKLTIEQYKTRQGVSGLKRRSSDKKNMPEMKAARKDSPPNCSPYVDLEVRIQELRCELGLVSDDPEPQEGEVRRAAEVGSEANVEQPEVQDGLSVDEMERWLEDYDTTEGAAEEQDSRRVVINGTRGDVPARRSLVIPTKPSEMVVALDLRTVHRVVASEDCEIKKLCKATQTD